MNQSVPGRTPAERARLARVFGDVLGETTTDERGADGSDADAPHRRDAELTREVPPHHG